MPPRNRSLMTPSTVAEQLCHLAREFKTNDPAQASQLKREFKDRSKNDVVRAVLYLMEVVGARDAQFKNLQEENNDLKEILKLNNIDLEKLADDDTKGTEGTAPGGDTAPVAAEGNTAAAAPGQSGSADSAAGEVNVTA